MQADRVLASLRQGINMLRTIFSSPVIEMELHARCRDRVSPKTPVQREQGSRPVFFIPDFPLSTELTQTPSCNGQETIHC